MPKKAILVELYITTRAIVDIPEGADINDESYDELIGEAALKKIRKHILEDESYPYLDNITDIAEDEEIPYDPEEEEE